MSFHFAKYSYLRLPSQFLTLHSDSFVSVAVYVANVHVLCIQPSHQTFSCHRRFYPSTVRETADHYYCRLLIHSRSQQHCSGFRTWGWRSWTVVLLKIQVYWDDMLFLCVDNPRRFKGSGCSLCTAWPWRWHYGTSESPKLTDTTKQHSITDDLNRRL